MTKATSAVTSKAMKEASKKIVPVPKHVPSGTNTAPFGKSPYIKSLNAMQDARSGTQVATPPEGQSDAVDAQPSEAEMQAIHAGRRATDPIIGHIPTLQGKNMPAAGGSDGQNDVVESGFSIFNQRAGAQQMTEANNTKAHSSDKPETKLSPDAQAKATAAVKAAEDKLAKKAAADKKRADEKAARHAAAVARAEAIAANKAARDAKAAELTAAGRTYVGSMTQLADRVKAGAYVKSMTGQLRSSDELAIALDAVPAVNVVILGMKALKLDVNPYTALNIGQQSMNLRNRMRGAIKKGTLTLQEVKDIRDKDGLATAEVEVAKKAEAKALRLKTAAEAQTLKLAAESKALEAKHAKEAEAAKAKTNGSTPTPAVKTAPVKKAAAKTVA